TEVVDSTGAGDALAAGYLVGGTTLALEAAARCVARGGAMPGVLARGEGPGVGSRRVRRAGRTAPVNIGQATREDLGEIATWRYEPPYDFYDGDQESVESPERYFAARNDDGALVGFYYFEPHDEALDYGLGMRPDLTGRGLGLHFFRAGLEFGRERYRAGHVRLYVASFNERAIKVYQPAGFRQTGRHI